MTLYFLLKGGLRMDCEAVHQITIDCNERWSETLHQIAKDCAEGRCETAMKGGEVAKRSVVAAWMLYDIWVWFSGKGGARNLVFFRVKWLRPAMKGTSCVLRLLVGSF